MTNAPLASIAIILVEPQFPGNIGMVCRAMKNMGLSQLRLVAGCNHLDSEAFKFAVAAGDLLEQADCYKSLTEALADITTSIATTRRSGKYRQELLTPPQAAQALLQQSGTTALVFGREDHGLSTADLSLCTLQATIPSSVELGSLNLAQAVLIFCYELFNTTVHNPATPLRTPVASGDLEPLFGHMSATLQRIGYLNPQNPEHIMRTLRRILFRAELDQRELAVLRGMFSQIDWASGNFSERKRQP